MCLEKVDTGLLNGVSDKFDVLEQYYPGYDFFACTSDGEIKLRAENIDQYFNRGQVVRRKRNTLGQYFDNLFLYY